jgi:hypothetical protein
LASQTVVGGTEAVVYDYFAGRFPSLLIQVYDCVCGDQQWRNEDVLKTYFERKQL